VLRYRIYLEQKQYAPTTINLHLAAVRRVAYEAADSGLLSPELAAGIRRVKGARRLGVPVGHWLTAKQGKRLLAGARRDSRANRRHYAMLAMLIGCGLRRGELLALRIKTLTVWGSALLVKNCSNCSEIPESTEGLQLCAGNGCDSAAEYKDRDDGAGHHAKQSLNRHWAKHLAWIVTDLPTELNDGCQTPLNEFLNLRFPLSGLCQVEKYDVRRIADWCVMARETQRARAAVHVKHRDVVGALIAHVKELACGIEIEAPRIIPAGPFLADEFQLTALADRENPDAVMQTIARIDEPAVARNQDLGAEVTASVPGRQAGDSLSRGQAPPRAVVVEQNDV